MTALFNKQLPVTGLHQSLLIRPPEAYAPAPNGCPKYCDGARDVPSPSSSRLFLIASFLCPSFKRTTSFLPLGLQTNCSPCLAGHASKSPCDLVLHVLQVLTQGLR